MSDTFTLALAGDVMLGRLVDRAIAERGFAYPWGDLLPVLRGVDLFFVNLECALTSHPERWSDGSHKPFYFRADPAAVETLKLGRVDFAALANNHARDYGDPGLLETVRLLDGAGIAHAGAGPNRARASAPASVAVGEHRVGVVAFADHPAAWAATENAAGINYTPVSLDPHHWAAVEQAIAEARRQADLVVFSIHWGPNMRPRPTGAFRDFARRVVEAGADIFWGHSAHVVQGIEIWQRRPILYDTGDFVDDYAVDPALRNDLSALFLLQVRPPAIERIELLPVNISRMQVNVARGEDREWLARRLQQLCAEMGTDLAIGTERLEIAAGPAPQWSRPATR